MDVYLITIKINISSKNLMKFDASVSLSAAAAGR